MTHVTVRNGLTLAYTVATINAALVLVTAFGVHMTQDQQASIVAFVNVAILLAARVLHLPEKTPTGTVQVRHVPILEETVAPPAQAVTTPPVIAPAPPAASPVPEPGA